MFNWEIMSWLFKDPTVTVAWLNFDHAQSNSKKWPKKIKLPQMKFFFEKQLIKFWPFSLCKIFKKFLERIQSYEVASFLGPKWSIGPKKNFFGKND